ncbi:hypothetical protein [Microlunatus sp. GCM10028923]|uniref:hypothetical protein n=1 Tax=Microlunatus sp. GCM10028923 TaxID=3273400 RepID=UPI00360D4C43
MANKMIKNPSAARFLIVLLALVSAWLGAGTMVPQFKDFAGAFAIAAIVLLVLAVIVGIRVHVRRVR